MPTASDRSSRSNRRGISSRIFQLSARLIAVKLPDRWGLDMENDTIRASGGNTLVDIWIDGRMRSICVAREAIEYLCDEAAATEKDRCEFVRTHLALVIKAARQRLEDGLTPGATIVIGAGVLDAPPRSTGRKAERRKGERRRADNPGAVPPSGERRRGERRKSERRSRATTPRG